MWMDADDLVYRADGLERMIRKAESELRRPLASSPPWLRCTCAILVGAQLGRAVYQGVAVSAAGAALAHVWTRQNPQDATQAVRVAWRGVRLTGRAARALARAGRLGWQAGRERGATPTPANAPLLVRLSRAVWMVRCGALFLREVRP